MLRWYIKWKAHRYKLIKMLRMKKTESYIYTYTQTAVAQFVQNSPDRLFSLFRVVSRRRGEIISRVVIGVILVFKSAGRVWALRGFSGFRGCDARPWRGMPHPTNYGTRGQPASRPKNLDFPGHEIKQTARLQNHVAQLNDRSRGPLLSNSSQF